MLPQAADARTGPRIGKYLITGRIGRGGMGMVYRGLDPALDREVAIKTLVAEGSFDPESRRRFEVEARAAAKLAHPNIVTVHELGEDRGILFIAMEMLPGVDLDSLLRSGEALPLAEKLDIVAQVCRGLAFAHDRGVVHRDIKPSNVRLLDDGTAKIMDFGIAKLGAGHHITKTGMMVGTVHYMSPEQVRGKPLDGRSDVFSAGVILYELLAGERPFPGEDVTQILYKIVNEEPQGPGPQRARRAGAAAPGDRREGPGEGTGRTLLGRRGARPGPERARRRRPASAERDGRRSGGGARDGPARAARRPCRGGRRTPARAGGGAPRLRRRAPRAAHGAARAEAPAAAARIRRGRLPGARGDVPGRAHAARGGGRPGDARRPRGHRARADRLGRRRPLRADSRPREPRRRTHARGWLWAVGALVAVAALASAVLWRAAPPVTSIAGGAAGPAAAAPRCRRRRNPRP